MRKGKNSKSSLYFRDNDKEPELINSINRLLIKIDSIDETTDDISRKMSSIDSDLHYIKMKVRYN